MKKLGTFLRVAAIIAGIILGAPLVINELVTKIDPTTGQHYDVAGRKIYSEDRHHRALVNPLTRVYDALYYLAGAGIVGGLWCAGTRCQQKSVP